jgi:hypothetical protein
MVELNTGITCACLPVLKSFISRFSPNLLGTSRHTSTQKQDPRKKIPKALNSHNSFHMQNVKAGVRSDISSTEVQVSDSEKSREDGKGYGNGVQVTTVFEVEYHPDEGDYPIRNASVNTSERDLVLPLHKV